MLRHSLLLLAAGALASCGSNPPPMEDTANLPPVEQAQDWENWSKDGNLARRVEGTPLTGEAITARLVGGTLSGCYPSGETFAERLTDNGQVLEAGTGRLLAKYQIQNDYLCFAYPNQQPACYTVTEKAGVLYFYTAGGFRLVAASTCPIPENSKGLG